MSTVGSVEAKVREQAARARAAARALSVATAAQRERALESIAAALRDAEGEIRIANEADLAAAREAGLPAPLVNRLGLAGRRFEAMVRGVEEVRALPDPLGEVIEAWERPNGLRIEKVRVPMGVIGVIYEARPNVTVDAAVLCLKAGSAVLLKGGKEADRTNAALVAALRRGLEAAGLPADAVQYVGGGREGARALMGATGLVDVLIPRGGAGLIRAVVEEARVPVIETGTGVCHVYVDGAADPDMAEAIVVNAKCSNPAVCNAAETLLVDAAAAPALLPRLAAALREAGVTLRGCERTRELVPWAEPATEEDWAAEYLDLILAVRVVDGLDAALEHIARYGTRHSEAIVTEDPARAERFLREVDAAAVYWNASTRFTDGGEFGFGAEIGISTQKLHARGPMGLREITTYKYVIRGTGQVRG
ncbi:glutamate-5-semialdehyde dehydrogenase [Caldinitratiruptor microaerophilus]|uniref:Gamma-glutamyl phosphate reductase n=1 Tax=Caldinitratiruptor microaerophilus TaxID=671077 RepID=A0AA35CKU5_9FIRM|nr:glutamate-5-semialdehyde dehydrogenase [Caldinitratiruptor microaerophilus]BDG59171.1 gamma-glutamyl phosphate reductase [Caldinitratiruptor microaerophilus]